jgi:hypothetical protein
MQDNITVTLGDETKTVLMSYGLLNELTRLVGEIDNIPEISLDPVMSESVLISVLSTRDAKGKIEEPFNMFASNISTETASELLNFVGAHLTDFFLTSLEKTKVILDGQAGRLKVLMPTSPGSGA